MATPPPSKRARTDSSSHDNKTNGSSSTLPPLSLSILGIEPFDEFIKEVADFVHYHIANRPQIDGNIEVEAKIGILRDVSSNSRLNLPILVETILRPDWVQGQVKFESNMSMRQHKHFNGLLNDLVASSPCPPIVYKHHYLHDSFYPEADGHSGKIRVTRDEKAENQVVECVRKLKLGDLNIFSPKHRADWRITVNLEVTVPHPIGSSTFTRRKDRLSYTHEEFNIDLSQVHTGPGADPLHELEVEIARPALLLALAEKRNDPTASDLDKSGFDELIRAFVNNARILVKNADGGEWQ
ncbi:mRNA triphosphatase CET1 [Flagelloscypha sp. PMI_526]|nr:mRNA triphosphatase CET1 [Flagelloscypha sp. PMI_526]